MDSRLLQTNTLTFDDLRPPQIQEQQAEDVSFVDLLQIQNSRSQHLTQALLSNLSQKRSLILDLTLRVQQLVKECEAKSLKLSHLRHEREGMIQEVQAREERARERARIEVKRREEERKGEIARREVERQISEQQAIINQMREKVENMVVL